MTTTELIVKKLASLPEPAQQKVLNFVDYLETNAAGTDDEVWSGFSLASAMSGMEGEDPLYSPDDLKDPSE